MARLVHERDDIVPVLADVFRRYGFDGASLALIGKHCGLGKGSLYHFFPGGKDEMAAAVLAEIDAWFAEHVFRPLRNSDDPQRAVAQMFQVLDVYFQGGDRICLAGLFVMGTGRDRFAIKVKDYFAIWRETLADALARMEFEAPAAAAFAEEILINIEGALILARALGDPVPFSRMLARLRARLKLPA